jgi:hypothetical protein
LTAGKILKRNLVAVEMGSIDEHLVDDLRRAVAPLAAIERKEVAHG